MPTSILIAEANPSQAFVLRDILEAHGYAVGIATKGRQALDMAEAIGPSLIISAVDLPEMTGYQLTAHVKKAPSLSRTPVLLATSITDSEDVIQGLTCGADGFVLKPYETNHLLDSVRQALTHQDRNTPPQSEVDVDVIFGGRQHRISMRPVQSINFLLSAYEVVALAKRQLLESNAQAIRAQRFLDSLIESSPHVISIKDAETLRYTRINRAFETLTGIGRDEILGKRDDEIFPPEDADPCLTIDREALDRRAVLDIQETVLHTRNNGKRVLHIKKFTLPDEQGRPSYLIGISEDVTLRSSLEALVQKLNATLSEQVAQLDVSKMELEASNKDLESFSYSIAHDLRSPLNVIGGYVGLLKKQWAGRGDEKSLHCLSAIDKSVKHMDALINDLLAFSKLARQALKKTDVDMDQLVRKTVATVLQHVPHEQLPDIEQSELLPAQADSALIAQVWVNLISNAVKYSSKSLKPRIRISARREGSEIIYSVQDNGAGFDMAQYDKLFGIFQRLHGSSEFEGTGIGLAIVHRVVMHHGGRVWAEGEVNEGATFSFALPA